MKFKYTEEEMQVLKSFASINDNMIIYPDKFVSIGTEQSLVGIYRFEKPYDYEAFGIFDLNQFLSLIGLFKGYQLSLSKDNKSVKVISDTKEVKYNLTPNEMIKQKDTDKLVKNFKALDKQLDFILTSEELSTLKKINSVLKPERIYLESVEESDLVKLTATDRLQESTNPYITSIKNPKVNGLYKTVMYFNMQEMKLLEGEYHVQVSTKGISRWINQPFGVVYYIGCFVDKN